MRPYRALRALATTHARMPAADSRSYLTYPLRQLLSAPAPLPPLPGHPKRCYHSIVRAVPPCHSQIVWSTPKLCAMPMERGFQTAENPAATERLSGKTMNMKKRFLFIVLLLTMLGCRFGIQAEAIPWSQCAAQENCRLNVANSLEYLYTWSGTALSSFLTDYRALWIWKAFHPGVCTAFAGPLPEELENTDWDHPAPNGVEVVTWSLLTPTTIFWKGGTGADITVRNTLLPRDFPLGGCAFWASADIASPDVHYRNTFGLKWYTPGSAALRNLRWVCELWHADPYEVSKDLEEAQRRQREEIEQLLEQTAFRPRPEDLARLCDWYLWCNADMSTCHTGGRSVHFQFPGQEPPPR